MKSKILFALFTVYVGFSTTACAPKSDEHPIAHADLQRLANAVTTFSMKKSTEAGPAPAKPSVIQRKASTAATESSNVIEDEFTDEDGTYSFRAEFFLADGVTPVTVIDTLDLDEYVVKQHAVLLTSKYESTMDITIRQFGYTPGLLPESEMSGTGVVDYYNDDLVLRAEKIQASISNETGMYIRYDMSFMDGKYFFTLETSLTPDEVNALDSGEQTSEPFVSGDITDAGGTLVGTFVLNTDDSVTILDENGTVVRAAGQ